MPLVNKKILVSDLRLDADSEKYFSGSKILQTIASKSSRDQIHVFLTAFPIVARKSGKGFVVISGKRSYQIARSLIPENQKIQVLITDAQDDDAEIFSAFDDLYAALVFHADLDSLESLAKPHVRNRAIFRITNDLSKRDQWRSLLQPEPKARKPDPDPSESGKPKFRGRKPKNAAPSVKEHLAKDGDTPPVETQASSVTDLPGNGNSVLNTASQIPPHGD